MSKASDAFENEIVTMVSKHIGENLPSTLPDWMLKEGIIPGGVKDVLLELFNKIIGA